MLTVLLPDFLTQLAIISRSISLASTLKYSSNPTGSRNALVRSGLTMDMWLRTLLQPPRLTTCRVVTVRAEVIVYDIMIIKR